MLYQMACIYALNCQQYPQDIPLALSNFSKAILVNPRWIAEATTDTDLRPLRGQTRFRDLLRAAALLQQTARAPDPARPPISERPSLPDQPTDARTE
jgi:hypothetical protein